MLSYHPARLTVLVLVGLATAASVLDASASAWSTGLGANSTGKARSSTAPSPPGGVTASCVSSSQPLVTVTWSAVPRAQYTVYRSSTSATKGFSQVASALTTTSWTSSSLASGSTYWFQVAATVGINWKSANSSSTAGRLIKKSSPICS